MEMIPIKKVSVITMLLLQLGLLPPQMTFPRGATPDEFANWQLGARPFLTEVLYNGPPPERVPLEPVFGAKETRDGYELVEVAFNDRPGHVTRGRLARPL